jgi:hypothetical protein
MNRRLAACAFFSCVLACALASSGSAVAQQATELPSRPFQIKTAWPIGGTGPWDYLTMDASAQRLYIAHGHSVQVVDVSTGALAGEISGMVDAHEVALDDTGEFGYISDGSGGKIVVFDRRTLSTVATIENVPSPRALVYEPQTKLLFAVRVDLVPTPRDTSGPRTTTHITPRPAPPGQSPANPNAGSSIAVIDTQSRKIVAEILLPGVLGFAQTDTRGNLYVNSTDRNRILVIDAETVAGLIARQPGPAQPTQASNTPTPTTAAGNSSKQASRPATAAAQNPATAPFLIEWDQRDRPYRSFSVNGSCAGPKALAVDNAHERLFAACDNQKLLVLNAETGESIASLPIGPGVEAIGYDANRNLIYSANGGADGTLTVISQSVTDSYAVVQTLPTRQRARTLAVNPESGQVYLVTDLLGVTLAQPTDSNVVHTNPVNGTFQVLVVGN